MTFFGMKSAGICAFFLCLSLSLQVGVCNAMCYEKTDSLPIRLSGEKSKESPPAQETGPAMDVFSVPVEDSLPRRNVEVAECERLRQDRDGGIRRKMDGERILRSVNEGTLFGTGGYMMKDTYLSPERYGGIGFRFMNERMRFMGATNYKVSRQNRVNVEMSSTRNGAENASFLSAFVDYSLGYHYRFSMDPYFKILLGGCLRGMFGTVYNTRNGNNPMTLHADPDLNLSLIAVYVFRVGRLLPAIRYQFETPFAGVLFCPAYGQSYYEIFTLGNTAEVFRFTSFHNKFAARNYLTLDFPMGAAICRVGYFGSCYTVNVQGIDKYIISHSLMVGFVKELVPFGSRDVGKRNLFHSAYY
jgi:hypothetical protein